jgi:hypothetical protein
MHGGLIGGVMKDSGKKEVLRSVKAMTEQQRKMFRENLIFEGRGNFPNGTTKK